MYRATFSQSLDEIKKERRARLPKVMGISTAIIVISIIAALLLQKYGKESVYVGMTVLLWVWLQILGVNFCSNL